MKKTLIFAAALAALCGCSEDAGEKPPPAVEQDAAEPRERRSAHQNSKDSITDNDMSEQKSPEIIEKDGASYARVCTLSSAAANEEFFRNVNVMRNLRRAVLDARSAGKTAEADALLRKLDENNRLMAKTYGYSLTRDYLQQIVKTRVLVRLSDEEFAAAEKDGNVPADELLQNASGKYRLVATISGVQANGDFRANVRLVQTQRDNLIKARAEAEKLSGAEKDALAEKIAKAEETLVKNNAEMTRRYGFSLTRNYLMQVVVSELYVKRK